jgi:hypothetical protein
MGISLSDLWLGIEGRVLALVHKTEACGCRVINTGTQNIDSATVTALTFNSEIYDTDGCWDAGSPTRLTAQRDGYYLAGGTWMLASGQNTAASRMQLAVKVNDTTWMGGNEMHTIANKGATVGCSSGMFWLSAGDYVELVAYHDEGATKAASAGSVTNQFCNGWLMRVG